MPSRIIREGILTSERVDALSLNAEVFYRRVMSVVDDYGRFSANPALLRASCYPLRLDIVKEDAIKEMLAECVVAGLIVVYKVGAKSFLEMIDFKQQVRAKDSKYPSPDEQVPSTCVADDKQVKTSVHLGEGVVEVEDGGVSESAARAFTSVDLSIAMRKSGVQTQPADPRLIALAEQGITPETVEAACTEAKRSKPNETIGLGYVAKILERWAKDASALNAKGAGAQKPAGAWWATDATVLAKGSEFGMNPLAGESMQTFKGRIQAVIDNNGKAPAQKQKAAVIIKDDPKGQKPVGMAPLKSFIKIQEQA